MSIPKEAVSLEYALSHLSSGNYNYWAVDHTGDFYLFNSNPFLDLNLKIWLPSDQQDSPIRCARIDMSEYGPNGWKSLSGEIK